MNPNVLLECPRCGWCHFGVTEAYVRQWEIDWKKFWPTLDAQGRENYGVVDGPPTRQLYLQCFRCGNKARSKFFKTKKELLGHTTQPILMTEAQEKLYAFDKPDEKVEVFWEENPKSGAV